MVELHSSVGYLNVARSEMLAPGFESVGKSYSNALTTPAVFSSCLPFARHQPHVWAQGEKNRFSLGALDEPQLHPLRKLPRSVEISVRVASDPWLSPPIYQARGSHP